MTEPYNGNFIIKPVRGEFVAARDLGREIEALDARIVRETTTTLPITRRPDGLEAAVRHRTDVEQVIDNRRINREGRTEAYMDLDPAGSNFPPRTPSRRS